MPWSSARRNTVFGGPTAIPGFGGGGGYSGGGYAAGPGTSVGVSDPSLNEFPTGPFIPPPPGASTSGTSSLQRTFPERIGGNLMLQPNQPQGFDVQAAQAAQGVLQTGLTAQARIGANPFAIADTISGGLLKRGAQAANDTSGGLLGGVLGFIGGAAERVFSLPAAMMNADPSLAMAALWNKGDSTVITPELLMKNGLNPTLASEFKKNGLPVLGWLGLTGDQMTIGDLKKELESRGFLQDAETGQQITWEDFSNLVRNDPFGQFKQGHAMVNESAMSDFLLQTGAQFAEFAPLGLGLGLLKGGVGAAARAIGLSGRALAEADAVGEAAQGIGTIAKIAGRTEPSLGFGVNNAYRVGSKIGDSGLHELVDAGIVDAVAKPAAQSAAELLAGGGEAAARGATMKGLAQFGKRMLYPNIKGLTPFQRYLVGQTGLRTAQTAIEFGTGAVENLTGSTDIPLISDLHNFFEAVDNNTIVSDDAAFSAVLAFRYPVHAGVGRAAETLGLGKVKGFVTDAPINAALRGLDKEFGPGTVEALGGREAAAAHLDRAAQTIAYERLIKGLGEGVRTRWESVPEASLRMRMIHNTVKAMSDFLIRTRQVHPHDIVQKFRDVHENPVRSFEREDGVLVRERILPYGTRLSTDTIVRRARQWAEASKSIADPFFGMQTAVVGRAPFMAAEDLAFAKRALTDAAVDGKVDAQFIRDLFYETPGLLDDPMVSAETHQFFVDAMNPARNEAFDVADVVNRLDQYQPPSRDAIWHNVSERDAAANAASQPNPDIGPVTNGIARNVHSEETARRVMVEADARVRTLRAERERLMERYRSLFSKRGNIKRSVSDNNWAAQADSIHAEMAYKRVENYSATSGKARRYIRGYDVPGERLGVVRMGDNEGLAAAARGVRGAYPSADVRFTPSIDHPGFLDVTGSYHFTNADAARAKAAEMGVDAIYDSSKALDPREPTHPPVPVPPEVLDAKVAEIMQAAPRLPEDQAVAATELLRVMAQNYARYNGGSPIDFINDLSFVPGGRRGPGALRQVDSVTAELYQILDNNGHGPSTAFKKTMDTSGRRFEVPTGKKPMSLADAWKVKMEGINPEKLSEADAIDLYRRTFEAHKGDLTDPVDNFRRAAFSMLSPGNNLTSNEIGFAALGVRTFADIERISKMTDDQIVRTIMDVNAGFKSVGAQGKAVRDLARKMVKDPTLLNRLPDELPADYITRVASNAGLNMKTANFAAMLSDPMTWPIGTVDVHVARSLISGELSKYLTPEDWPAGLREKYIRTAKTSIKNGKEVITYNQPGPRGKNTFTGSDYEKFNDVLRIAIERKYGQLPFDTAGAQWMHWDEVRGRYEPHTAVWPGTENLPHITDKEIFLEAKAAHVQADYLNPNVPGVAALDKSALFFQLSEEGKTKGSIEWDKQQKAIIRIYQKGDISTITHELAHNLRRNLHPDDQVIAEAHYGVKDGRWTVKHEEQFSRDFERYLRDGRAPTDAIREVFAKIATWMRDIYQTLKGTPLEKDISPEIRQIFDRALGKVDESARVEFPPDVVAYTRAHGGATFDPRTGKYHTQGGYGVGVIDGTFRKVDPNNADAVRAAIDDVIREYPNAQVGTWMDDAGQLHIDPSEVVPSLDAAQALAAKRKQEAIWDFTGSREIKTGEKVQEVTQPSGPTVFEREDPSLLLEREALRDKVRETDRQINQTKQDITAIRARAKVLKGSLNNLDESFRDMNADGSPKASGEDLRRLRQYTAFVRENYPMFQVEAGPRVMNLYEPDSNFLKNLMIENDATAHYLFNWGPLSRMQNAIRSAVEAATRPVRGHAESTDTNSRIYEVLMRMGATEREVSKFLENTKDYILQERTFGVGHEQIPMTRGMNAMGARQLTQQALMAGLGKNERFVANFAKRYGGEGLERMYVPITEAYNPVVRAIQRKIEQGRIGKGFGGDAQRLMESVYDAYHTAPGFASLASKTHVLAKFWYPLIRFTANPLYHVYNATEADIIGITQDGLRVRRAGNPVSAEVFRAAERGNPEAAAALHMQEIRLKAMNVDLKTDAYADELLRSATLDQAGVTMGYNPRRAAIMERQLDLQRPETILNVIHEFAKEDPAIQAALKRYGGNEADWVDGLTRDIYGIDEKGARQYISDLIKEQGWSREEFIQMQPLVDRVGQMMQKNFDDIYQMHVGNINRSRIERVLNSYWLYWPASYMLKANKWMFKVLTEGAFGHKINSGGAWTLQQLADYYHQKYVTSPQFQQFVDDNKDLEFMLSAVLPVAPWSDGVSLNRMSRYLGGSVGLWPQYSNFDPMNLETWAGKMSEIGPLYSIPLAMDVSKNIGKDLNWDFSQLGQPQGGAQPQNPVNIPGI